MKAMITIISIFLSSSILALTCKNLNKTLKISGYPSELISVDFQTNTDSIFFEGIEVILPNIVNKSYNLTSSDGKAYQLSVYKEIKLSHCRTRICSPEPTQLKATLLGGNKSEYFNCL